MLSVSEARRVVLGHARPLLPEQVPLVDAVGRVLAEDVVAARPLPPWDNSAMDGCACRHGDLASGAPLRLVDTVPAGGLACAVGAKEAVRIMTGAPLPEGADTVVPVEDLRIEGGHVHVLRRPAAGAHVRPAGEDVAAGERVLPAGTRIRPAEFGMLAALGRRCASVVRRPRVAILSTGNELADLHASPDDPRLRDANGYALSALVLEAGGVPVRLGIAPDAPDAQTEAVSRGLDADVFLRAAASRPGTTTSSRGCCRRSAWRSTSTRWRSNR